MVIQGLKKQIVRKIRTNSDGFTQFFMGSHSFLWVKKLAQKIITGLFLRMW